MKSIAFIIPYFGKFPPYFQLWMNSCRQNPTVDYFIVTDLEFPERIPENVHKIDLTFDEVRALIQKQFDFQICLPKPYKLCDFRPTYGLVFADWLNGYDFWGHCDVDLIWGNIRKYYTDDLLEQYDRVLNQGHCSIYRNTEKVNNYYHTLNPKGCVDWRDAYSSDRHFSFDEYAEHNGGGMSLIMEKNGVPIYAEWPFANISSGLQRFQMSFSDFDYYVTDEDARGLFFERDESGLYLHYRKYGQLYKKEFMYCHFSQRKMSGHLNMVDEDHYLLLPPGVVRVVKSELTEQKIKKIMRQNDYRLLTNAMVQDCPATKLAVRGVKKIKRTLKQR